MTKKGLYIVMLPLTIVAVAVLVWELMRFQSSREQAPAPSAISGPAPLVFEERGYYWLTGNIPQTIALSMKRRSPFRQNKAQRAGIKWDIDWGIKAEPDLNCVVKEASVVLKVYYLLPALGAGSDPDDHTLAQWKEYKAGLEAYLDAHKQRALITAQTLLQGLNSLQYADCLETEQQAERLANSLIQQARDQELAYDQQTRFGMENGLVFP